MTCISAAKKSRGWHLFGVALGEDDKTALVQELSKAITFLSYVISWCNFTFDLSSSRAFQWHLDVVVRRRKVAFHTSSHLTPTEVWWSAVSTTWEGHKVSSEVRLENCTQVWGVDQIWTACDHSWGKIALHTCSDLSKPVRTCLYQPAIYSDNVRW